MATPLTCDRAQFFALIHKRIKRASDLFVEVGAACRVMEIFVELEKWEFGRKKDVPVVWDRTLYYCFFF